MPEDRASDKARNSGKLLKSPDLDTTRQAFGRRWRARGLLILRESECARVGASAAARHHRRRPHAWEGPGTLASSQSPIAKG